MHEHQTVLWFQIKGCGCRSRRRCSGPGVSGLLRCIQADRRHRAVSVGTDLSAELAGLLHSPYCPHWCAEQGHRIPQPPEAPQKPLIFKENKLRCLHATCFAFTVQGQGQRGQSRPLLRGGDPPRGLCPLPRWLRVEPHRQQDLDLSNSNKLVVKMAKEQPK
jgi:hypothetical protein